MDSKPAKSFADASVRAKLMMASTGASLIALGILLIAWLWSDRAPAPAADFAAVPVEVEYAAPALDLTALDGTPVSLSDLEGSVVLVNLWATWCLPCREEMPVLQEFYQVHRRDGFVLVAINQEESADMVRQFADDHDLTFPMWLDPQYLAQREFHTTYLPSSYVIDRTGTVRLLWIGGISRENLDAYVPPLIQAQ
jgi:cytochrome c biogenesis protein CcmG, thiol:disulfide interchange protein DsbE